MCGIFGLLAPNPKLFSKDQVASLLRSEVLVSSSRGKEAAGVSLYFDSVLSIIRGNSTGAEFLRSPEFIDLEKAFLDRWDQNQGPVAAIGHSRLATSGHHGIPENNQPVNAAGLVGIHNGVIANYEEVKQEKALNQN